LITIGAAVSPEKKRGGEEMKETFWVPKKDASDRSRENPINRNLY